MNAAEILAIPLTEPERLFVSADIIPQRFKALAMDWHPDRGGDAKVFAHINVLKAEAEKKAAAGIWETPGLLELKAMKGTKLMMRFKRRHKIELGEMLVGSRQVAFLIRKDFSGLFTNAARRIGGPWRYPSREIEMREAKFIPVIAAMNETADHRLMIAVRGENDILAADLLEHMGGKIPPRHVAWVVSSLLNLCCLFEFNGIVHNGISPTTVFISPQFHSAFPLGGWWYAAPAGGPLTHLPPWVHRLASGVAKSKVADHKLDRECVRALALTLLGDRSGHSLRSDKDIPDPMLNFLRLPAGKSAYEDYAAWMRVLEDSFGPRKFVDLPISGSDVYT